MAHDFTEDDVRRHLLALFSDEREHLESQVEKPPTRLKLNLLENGIDFIRSGIENHFLEDDGQSASANKYVLLHMFAGVQLLLKERLRREHPSLIFEKVEDAGNDDRPTAGLDSLLLRLKSCAGVTISERDRRVLANVRKVRNRLEHYNVELESKHAEALIGELCEFAYFFMRDHLQEDLTVHLSDRVNERIVSLRAIAEEFEKQAARDWLRKADEFDRMSADELQELLERSQYHPKDDPVPQSVYWCPACGEEKMLGVADGMAVCTNPVCKQVEFACTCGRCGELIIGESLAWLCESCQGWFDAQ